MASGDFGYASSSSKVQSNNEDNNEDPVENMLKKTGCMDLHYKVQVTIICLDFAAPVWRFHCCLFPRRLTYSAQCTSISSSPLPLIVQTRPQRHSLVVIACRPNCLMATIHR